MKHLSAILLSILLCITLIFISAGAENQSPDSPPESQTEESQTEESQTEESQIENQSETAPSGDFSSPDTVFKIDNENTYSGMEESYENGYTPRIKNGYVSIILPLTAGCPLKNNRLTAALDLGDRKDNPFIYKNYQKTFSLSLHKINNTDETREIYCVRFDLPLSESRTNGVYPVEISVSAENNNNQEITGRFIIYVNIEDGKEPLPSDVLSDTESAVSDEEPSDGVSENPDNGSGIQETKPSSQPIILISQSTCKPSVPEAGKSFQLTVQLTNTSQEKNVQNMVIAVSCDNPDLILLNDSSTIYVEKLKKGASMDIILKYQASRDLADERCTISLSMSYDNEDAETLSSNGTITVPVKQPLSVKMNTPSIESSITAGDTIPLNFQVMNLGRSKIYNVRCEVSGNGLLPMNTAFVGNMEPGTSGEASMNLFIGTLQQNNSRTESQETEAAADEMENGDDNNNENAYGPTEGTFTLIYEDSDGKEYTDSVTFYTTIRQPAIVSSNTDSTGSQKTAGQWWVSVLIAGGLLFAGGICLYIIKRKKIGESL